MKTVQDIYTELGITSSTDLDTLLTKASNYKVISQSDINKIKALSVLPLGNNVKDKAEELKKRFTNIVLDEGAGQIHLLNVRTVLILEILDRLSNVKANKNGSATVDFNAKDVSAVKGTFSDTLKSTKEVVTPSAEIDSAKTDKVEPLGTVDTSSVGDNGKEFDEGHFKNLFLANLFNYESTSLLETLITLDKYSSDYPVDVKAKAKFEKEAYFNDKVTTSHVVPKDNSNRNLGTADYKWLNVYTSHLFATDVINDLTPNGNYNDLDLGNFTHKWRNGHIDYVFSERVNSTSVNSTNVNTDKINAKNGNSAIEIDNDITISKSILPKDENINIGSSVNKFKEGHFISGDFDSATVQNVGNNAKSITNKAYVDGKAAKLVMDNDGKYIIRLLDSNGNELSRIDLPLEELLLSGKYENGYIYLTLKTGQTISFPVGEIISGLASTTYVDDKETTIKSYVAENYYNKNSVDTKDEAVKTYVCQNYISSEESGDSTAYPDLKTGTDVKVNGTVVDEFNADSKLDKVTTTSTYNRVYVIEPTGTQGTRTIDRGVSANTIPQRGNGGVLKVGTPVDNEDAATKKYVDDTISGAGGGSQLYMHRIELYKYGTPNVLLCVNLYTNSSEKFTISTFQNYIIKFNPDNSSDRRVPTLCSGNYYDGNNYYPIFNFSISDTNLYYFQSVKLSTGEIEYKSSIRISFNSIKDVVTDMDGNYIE